MISCNMDLIRKIKRKLVKLRLQPIRVLCFHEVSDNVMDESPDWMPLNAFKKHLQELQREGCVFVSLEDARQHLKRDIFRFRKYVVLTADDGLRCQYDLLPWLVANRIPITMFLNPNSLEQIGCGKPYRVWFNVATKSQDEVLAKQLYMSREEWIKIYDSHISFACHGIKHDESAVEMQIDQFEDNVVECMNYLAKHPRFVPFYAYTYGSHSPRTDDVVKQKGLIPVLADGQKNYNDASCIHREILEYEYKKCLQK